MMPTGEMYEEWRKKKQEFQVRDSTRVRTATAVDAIQYYRIIGGDNVNARGGGRNSSETSPQGETPYGRQAG
jgi:hypothetical protein